MKGATANKKQKSEVNIKKWRSQFNACRERERGSEREAAFERWRRAERRGRPNDGRKANKVMRRRTSVSVFDN